MPSLADEAERSGVSISYESTDGTLIRVPEETIRLVLSALEAHPMQQGEPSEQVGAPSGKCYLPEFLESKRAWGISLQLYELRSRRNYGIGDFADLAEFCRIAGALGADFVGCNPLHALFTADPRRSSPFFPSNRRFLNPLYIAIDRIEGSIITPAELARAEWLRNCELIDYEGVCALKMTILRKMWKFRKGMPNGTWHEFEAFRCRGGEILRMHALFEALSAHFVERGHGAGWPGWPEAYRDSRSTAVAAFEREYHDEVALHIWLQWIADRQLRDAAAAAHRSGLRIGLYLDFAVGEAPDGSATWSEPEKFVPGMKIGAPPDAFSANGQDWGLAPLSPRLLAHSGSAHFGSLIARTMDCAGALRLDHAMSLYRLFFLPEGRSARDGAYVHYPLEQLLAVLAATSREQRSIIIGEDLGSVPPGFRDAMCSAGMLSYRVLCFETRDCDFLPPANYPRLALACVTTHDLPPLRGWWTGGDIALREQHGLSGKKAASDQQRERQLLKQSLLRALRAAGTCPSEDDSLDRLDEEPAWLSLSTAVHRFIARTPSILASARLADITGETVPTNLPGSADEYPNWRPKSSVMLEDLTSCAPAMTILAALAEERPR